MTDIASRYDVLPAAQRTLPHMLRRQAALFGEQPALSIGDARWTHAQAPVFVARRAAMLARAGVRRGDRVAIMCGNRVECIETFLACGWMGAVAVPINTAAMGPQIQYFLANSGARLLVMEHSFVERLQTADLSQCGLETTWVVGGAASAIDRVKCLAFPDAADAQPAEPPELGPDELLAILYTSGTTGPSKGVTCPHAQFYWWGAHTARILGVGQGDVLATTLPLFHINALNTYAQAALTGAEVVYLPRFSGSGFWPAMQACGATVVYLLGAMVPILLAQPEGPQERAHRVRLGLGPGVPAHAGAAFRERCGVQLLEGYGSTETNFVIASRPDAPRGGVMGWLQPGFEARVSGGEGDAALPDGEAGELLLRASEPHVFASGYFNMPDKTQEAWRGGWFHTGDRVVREADGAFRFIDRMKDAIRRRGENISSYEVEQVLLSHPAVATVAVYPVRSELAEDEVMASLIARPDVEVDAPQLARELAAYCESRLPYFAIPRYVDVVHELPRTENGKIQKFKLRERGVTPTTWDRTPGGAARKLPARAG